MMASHDRHLEWKTLGEEPVVRTPWFQVGLADVELPDGRRIDHLVPARRPARDDRRR
jgi:hypothetical protein